MEESFPLPLHPHYRISRARNSPLRDGIKRDDPITFPFGFHPGAMLHFELLRRLFNVNGPKWQISGSLTDLKPYFQGLLLLNFQGGHHWKLTCPLKRDHFNRKYIFQPLILRGHVSLRGGHKSLLTIVLCFHPPSFDSTSYNRASQGIVGCTPGPTYPGKWEIPRKKPGLYHVGIYGLSYPQESQTRTPINTYKYC